MDVKHLLNARRYLPDVPDSKDTQELEEYVAELRGETRKIKPVYRAMGEVLAARDNAESIWKIAQVYKTLDDAGISSTELRARLGNLSGTTWDEVRRVSDLDYSLSQYISNNLDVIRAEHKLKLAENAHRVGWTNVQTRHELILEAKRTGLTKTDARWVLGISNNKYTDFDRVWDTGMLWP